MLRSDDNTVKSVLSFRLWVVPGLELLSPGFRGESLYWLSYPAGTPFLSMRKRLSKQFDLSMHCPSVAAACHFPWSRVLLGKGLLYGRRGEGFFFCQLKLVEIIIPFALSRVQAPLVAVKVL